MKIWAAAIVVVGMGSGCKYGPYEFSCTDDASCGAGGKCEPGFNLCSFPNEAKCGPGGRSFGDLGGPNSGQCVGGQPPPDGGNLPDGNPPDGNPADAGLFCYGSAPHTICFASAPTGNLDVSTPTTFDTVIGTALTCATPMSGGTGDCVLAASTITISSMLRAIGLKPLVLVAADSISVPISGSIDVGSHRQPTESIGAGGDPVAGCNAGTPPGTTGGTSGGGAGGSFMGAGGDGGSGGVGGVAGVHGAAQGIDTVIRGGCPGQDGAGPAVSKGVHGHGGGAVFLIARNSITVNGTIKAGGEGGGAAAPAASGAGGGGSGGMIGFDAITIMVTGTLVANGGGGGEGSSNALAGNPGVDASVTNAAVGGSNATSGGGDGGNGASGAAAGPCVNGMDGMGGGGGGGGVGGAGLIKGPPASLGTSVSPAATP